MIHRGQESYVLHRFYREHEECARRNPNAVEVQADGYSEQPWMEHPLPAGYTDIGDELNPRPRQDIPPPPPAPPKPDPLT